MCKSLNNQLACQTPMSRLAIHINSSDEVGSVVQGPLFGSSDQTKLNLRTFGRSNQSNVRSNDYITYIWTVHWTVPYAVHWTARPNKRLSSV